MASEIRKPAEIFSKGKLNTLITTVYMPHLNKIISCNFFIPIIAKCQPLHRPSMQMPYTTAVVFIF